MEFSLEQIIHVIIFLVTATTYYWLLRERIVKLESKILVHEERLNKGTTVMESLNTSINNLNVTVAKLDATLETTLNKP